MSAYEEQTWLTVGEVARFAGVSVRTLHHYDEIALVRPSERSLAGYRLYGPQDLERLQHVVVYRRLGMSLAQVAEVLHHPEDAVSHLMRQRDALTHRLDELTELVEAINRALEKERVGMNLTQEEQRELLGESFSDEYAAQARERWGHTSAWEQSQARAKGYTKDDWARMKAQSDAADAAFIAAMEAGKPATSVEAMDAAEAARRVIETRFYEIDPDFHRALGDMYVADPRFTQTYESQREGMATYVREAIHANADRQVNLQD